MSSNITAKALNVGLAEFFKLNGEIFVCNGEKMVGNLRLLEVDSLPYVENRSPRGMVEIWFPEKVRAFSNPFLRGEYLEKENMRYRIVDVRPPDGSPAHWVVIAEADYKG